MVTFTFKKCFLSRVFHVTKRKMENFGENASIKVKQTKPTKQYMSLRNRFSLTKPFKVEKSLFFNPDCETILQKPQLWKYHKSIGLNHFFLALSVPTQKFQSLEVEFLLKNQDVSYPDVFWLRLV